MKSLDKITNSFIGTKMLTLNDLKLFSANFVEINGILIWKFLSDCYLFDTLNSVIAFLYKQPDILELLPNHTWQDWCNGSQFKSYIRILFEKIESYLRSTQNPIQTRPRLACRPI